MPLRHVAVGWIRERYKLDIPSTYTSIALSGKQAIVYERYDLEHSSSDNPKAWILWMLNKKI